MDLKKIAKMQIGGPKYPDKKKGSICISVK